MNRTPSELLAPYKAALVAAGRDAVRAIREIGSAGARYEIPGTVLPALVVVGDEAEVSRLLRAPAREPKLGGRRTGDVPAPVLSFDEPDPGTDGPPVVDSPDLVTIRRWLRTAAEAGIWWVHCACARRT